MELLVKLAWIFYLYSTCRSCLTLMWQDIICTVHRLWFITVTHVSCFVLALSRQWSEHHLPILYHKRHPRWLSHALRQLHQHQLRQARHQVAAEEGQTHHCGAVYRHWHHWELAERVPWPHHALRQRITAAQLPAAVRWGRLRSGDLYHWWHLYRRETHEPHCRR